jgi:hypothetical protein
MSRNSAISNVGLSLNDLRLIQGLSRGFPIQPKGNKGAWDEHSATTKPIDLSAYIRRNQIGYKM